MQKKDNILNELQQFAPIVSAVSNQIPYTIPTGYFDSLAANIIEHCNTFKIIVKTANPYEVPEDYFSNLDAKTLLHVKESEIKSQRNEILWELSEIAPLLNSIQKQNVYTIPENYFKSISPYERTAAPERESASVITFGRKMRSWVTYAAAASVLVFFSSISYLFIDHHMKSVDKSPTIEQRLADLNDDEIINYLKYDSQPDDINLNSIEQDPDINHLLINTSDEEIQKYLNE